MLSLWVPVPLVGETAAVAVVSSVGLVLCVFLVNVCGSERVCPRVGVGELGEILIDIVGCGERVDVDVPGVNEDEADEDIGVVGVAVLTDRDTLLVDVRRNVAVEVIWADCVVECDIVDV